MSGEMKVTLRGHLAADAVVKLANGREVAEVRVACGIRRKDSSGEWQELRTDWVTVTFWAEHMIGRAAQLKKGQYVRVEGFLHPRAYIDKNGEAQPSSDVLGEEVALLLKNPAAEAQPAAGRKAA